MEEKNNFIIIASLLYLGFSIFLIVIFIQMWSNTNKIVDNTKAIKENTKQKS